MAGVDRIIDEASLCEEAEEVKEQQKLRENTFTDSSTPYAVDAPDGDHDLENIEEHMEGVNRIIDVAAVTEDAQAITEMHDAVLGKTLFAVDAPDGEHDFEDMVSL